MVALRALHASAEEQLRGVLHLRLHGLHLAIPCGGGVLAHITGSGEHGTREFIVAHVLMQTISDPAVKGEVAAHGAGVTALVAQERAPFVGEIICVIRAGKQGVDQLIALGRVGAFEERLGLGIGWQAAGDINAHSANECGVIAHGRGGHTHALELSKHELINEIARLRGRCHRRTQGHTGLIHTYLSLIAHHHGHIARLLKELHVTRVIYLGDFLVVRLVGGDVGGVLGVTVTIDRGHADLLFGIGAHQTVLGVHLHSHHRGVGLFATRHAHGHPAGDQGEVMAIRIKPRATAVRQNGRALEEQQAVGGGRRAQATAAALFNEVLVIFVWLKAEQRKTEPVLAAAFAVATTTVTAGLGEDRHDFVCEIDRLHHAVLGHRHLHLAFYAVDSGSNGR